MSPPRAIRLAILAGLENGPATLPKLVPKADPINRYVTAKKLEQSGLIARVGTVRTRSMRGGLRRVMWKLTGAHP